MSDKQPLWELCPKCQGEGQVANTGNSTNPWRDCPVCHGGQLISSVTGQPREKVITIQNTGA